MKHLTRVLFLLLLGIPSAARTALKNDRNFLAHREEVSNLGMDWVTSHHYHTNASKKSLGSTVVATPFYGESTNNEDLARLFGVGETSQIKVTKATRPTTANLYQALYSFNVDHSPNSDGTSTDEIPLSGTATFKPQRRAWGALLNWNQSLNTILPGLRFSLRAPIVEVSTSMKTTFVSPEASAVRSIDGTAGATIDSYFNGQLSKSLGTNTHVIQEPLRKHKFNNTWQSEIGVGDIAATLQWDAIDLQRLHVGVTATLQVPTGNMPRGEYLFEPIYGARGHFAGGFGTHIHFDGYQGSDGGISCDIQTEWKYYFKGTEKRIMGIYDTTAKVVLPASSYRGLMKHKESGVKPAANILSIDHTVTPGHQLECLAGLSFRWGNITCDVGYNLFVREKEKSVQKGTWSDDTYAIAHNRYSMHTAALGKWVIGGGVRNGGDTDGHVMQDSRTAIGSYDDTNSPIQKHQNYIGANGDTYIENFVREDNLDDNGAYPGAYTSMGGPLQSWSKTTSGLSRRSSFYDSSGDALDAKDTDAFTTNVTGVDIDVVTGGASTAGTLGVRYNVTSTPTVTEAQITHSVVAGLGYKMRGDYPLILGVGGQYEFQDKNRNSALEGWKLWAKMGVSF